MGLKKVPPEYQRGAALVEFAITLPLLLLLLFGIVEFGWLFSQNLDVRHGAREGARLAAVNFPDGAPPPAGPRTSVKTDALVAEICRRMQTATGVEISIQSPGSVGSSAVVSVSAPGQTLSGFLDFLLPSDLTLESSVEIRLEQPATWADTSPTASCP
jgi:hypothetical protein